MVKHAVIICHPRGRAFTRLTAQTYIDAVKAKGHEVVVRDLYGMNFDPRLQSDELPDAAGAKPRPEVLIERMMLKDVDVFALFYPIWFGSPPAMMKGYVERVLGTGFGYAAIKDGGSTPLLVGRKLISFTSTGSENVWLVDSGAWAAVRKIFDERLCVACGLEALDHVNFGGVDADMNPDRASEAIEQVREAVTDLFPAAPPKAGRKAAAKH